MVFLWAGTLVVGAPFVWDEGEMVKVSLTRSPLKMLDGNYEWPFLSSVRVTELTLLCTIPLPTPLLFFSILLSERSTCHEGTKRICDMLPRLLLIFCPSLRMCYFFFMSSFSLFCINWLYDWLSLATAFYCRRTGFVSELTSIGFLVERMGLEVDLSVKLVSN